MEYNTILKDLKDRKFKPVYFLQGEEPFFIDEISNYIAKNVLDESERDFNQAVLYGIDIEIQDILNEAKQYPMMADYRVVIVKEAQELSRTIGNLADYFANPTLTTILVICFKYKKIDGKTKVAKDLKKIDYLFTSEKVKDYKIGDWIIAEGKNRGLTVNPKAAILMSEFLGDDLNKIIKTFEKLLIVLEGETLIDEKAVYNHVGVSKEYNVFEFQKALAKKDVMKSNMIANHFGNNSKNYPMVVTLSFLYGFFVKVLNYHALNGKVPQQEMAQKMGINPFFMKDYAAAAQMYPMGKLAKIIGYLRDADLKAKGVGASNISESELMKELVFKILH